jgi:P4 family phage/plasmid primase-like protien
MKNNVNENVKEIDLPNANDIKLFGGSNKKTVKSNSTKDKKDKYNFGGEKVPEWVQVNEKWDISINAGLLADYLINNVPAIYVASQLYIYENGVYRKSLEDEDMTIVRDLIKTNNATKYATVQKIRDAAGQWKMDRRVKIFPEEVNINSYILNFKNTAYNIETGELIAHSPEHKFTIQINANYDPNVKGEVFEKFIKEAIPNEQNRKVAQEIMGYCLTTLTKAKKFFILLGQKDTGKSTFLRILENLIPKENISHVELQEINKEYNRAQLFNKILNIFADLPNEGIKDTGLIKALTGEDTISARFIYGTPFSYVNKAKMIFSTNEMPSNYGDTSNAFYERLIILPFNQRKKEEEQDKDLTHKLVAENDYIIMWALEGLKRLISQNFVFTKSEEMNSLLQEYRVNSNNVLQFVNEKCMLNKNAWVYRTQLYSQYQRYCNENGFIALNSTKFNKELESNYKLERKQMGEKRLRAFVGIELR